MRYLPEVVERTMKVQEVLLRAMSRDGRPHTWLAPRPSERPTLLTVVDGAIGCVLAARLVPATMPGAGRSSP